MASRQNPYEVFAEELSAVQYQGKSDYSADDIKAMDNAALKKSYKKMAMKWHPDRPEGKTEDGQNRMLRINGAYEILGDTAQREAFDRGDIDADGEKLRTSNVDLGTSFDNLWAEFGMGGDDEGKSDKKAQHQDKPAGHKANTAKKANLDVKFKLSVDFMEAACGTVKTLNLKSTGTKFQLDIPAGTDEGDQLRARGKGRSADGKTGDAIAQIEVRPHEYFTRSGNDIHLDLPVTFCEAALGQTVTVPTIHGPTELALPQGTADGDVLTLSGKGIKGGDQVMTVATTPLAPIDDELASALKSWEERHPAQPRAKFQIG